MMSAAHKKRSPTEVDAVRNDHGPDNHARTNVRDSIGLRFWLHYTFCYLRCNQTRLKFNGVGASPCGAPQYRLSNFDTVLLRTRLYTLTRPIVSDQETERRIQVNTHMRRASR